MQDIKSAGREHFPWHESVVAARNFLERSLHTTHPIMLDLLEYWSQKMSDFNLIKVEEIRAALPLTIGFCRFGIKYKLFLHLGGELIRDFIRDM